MDKEQVDKAWKDAVGWLSTPEGKVAMTEAMTEVLKNSKAAAKRFREATRVDPRKLFVPMTR